MAFWWTDSPSERYWCEITDREDLGANLWSPQADEAGKAQWSYALIKEVVPGDIVFHYSTPVGAFVAASVACGVLEECPIIWAPHGTVGRSKTLDRNTRPGWRRALTGFRKATSSLPLSQLDAPNDRAWIEAWVKETTARWGSSMTPIQLYPKKLRAAQGYLTKMPRAFVERWTPLRTLANDLSLLQDELDASAGAPAATPHVPGMFAPKSSDSYEVVIKGGRQLRTRNHEKLIDALGHVLMPKGATLETSCHPIDVMMRSPRVLIIEAKTVGLRNPGYAVREAVGQLLEYRHFIGPKEARLCIALDTRPPIDVATYVEESLQMLILWVEDGEVLCGPRTAVELQGLGLVCPTTHQPKGAVC